MRRAALLLLFVSALFYAGAAPAAQTETAETEIVSEDGHLTLVAPAATELGMPFLVRLTSLDPLGEASVNWLGRQVLPAVSVWNDKHIVLAMLGTDVQTTPPGPSELVVVVTTAAGRRSEFSRMVEVREKVYPEEPDKESPALSAEEQARVRREARQAAEAIQVDSPLRRWFLPFDRPLQTTGPDQPAGTYGSERAVGGRQTFRRGVDFAAAPGTPVHACGSGRVIMVADHLLAGNSVYLDHGNGVVSMYFHLLRADVALGQDLERGDVIGLSGASGRDGEAKLHFAVAVQGRLVDPEPLFINNAEGLLPN